MNSSGATKHRCFHCSTSRNCLNLYIISNAIENSTLTLQETERILLELQTARRISVRELFEARNLAKVTECLILRTQRHIDQRRDSTTTQHAAWQYR